MTHISAYHINKVIASESIESTQFIFLHKTLLQTQFHSAPQFDGLEVKKGRNILSTICCRKPLQILYH